MKNKKLKLDELQVKSFITRLEGSKEDTVKVKGGSGGDWPCTGPTDCDLRFLQDNMQ